MMYRLTIDKPPLYMWTMYSREREMTIAVSRDCRADCSVGSLS